MVEKKSGKTRETIILTTSQYKLELETDINEKEIKQMAKRENTP